MPIAKIFWSGNSQAVRLPKEFRFESGTEEGEIRREGDQVILKPVKHEEWPADFWRAFEGMPVDFERGPQRPSGPLRLAFSKVRIRRSGKPTPKKESRCCSGR